MDGRWLDSSRGAIMPLSDEDIWGASPAAPAVAPAAVANAPVAPAALSDEEVWGAAPKEIPDSARWHALANNSDPRFPNVKGEGGILPAQTTYNPDGTVDESHLTRNWKDSAMLRSIPQGIGDLLESAENKSIEETPDSLNAMTFLAGVPSMARGAVDALPAIAKPISKAVNAMESASEKLPGILGDSGSGSPMPGSGKAAKMDAYTQNLARNEDYVQGINKNAQAMKDSCGEIYDKAREISQGVDVHEPTVKRTLTKLHDDLAEDPAYNGTQGSNQAFKDIQAVLDSFDQSGNIPLDSVTLLKRRVDDLYSPNMSQARGTIYNALKTQLNDVIKRAKTDNPEWGTVMDAGNNLFKNYQSTFVDDTLANKKWSLADKAEYDRVANSKDPLGAPVSTETRARTADIAKINNLAEYEAMLRKLPPEMHDQFTQDVIAASKENSPSLAKKIGLIYNTAKQSPLGVAKSLYGLVRPGGGIASELPMARQFPHVEDAMDYHTGIANDAHGQYLDDLQAAQNQPKPTLALPAPGYRAPMTPDQIAAARAQMNMPLEVESTVGNRPFADSPKRAASGVPHDYGDAPYNYLGGEGPPVPAKPLALPAPDRPMAAATGEAPRPMTDDEWQAHIDSGRMAKEMGNTPDVRRAQKSLTDSLIDTEVERALRGAGFKHGGAVKVNREPTAAQKVAGNYKKHHVKFNGLDISIENPRGSKRSGVSADGEEWHSIMPDHYGYIKRTQGADGDHIDVYLGQNHKSPKVYIIDQKDAETGRFDEHKCMLGYPDKDAAVAAYKSAFSDKKNRIMKVTRMTIQEFKEWLKNGNTKGPVRKGAA